MQGNTLVKLVIVAIVLFVLWKEVLPRLTKSEISKPAEGTSAGTNCVFEARGASDYWGGTLGHFANPPYDMAAWDDFKSKVDARIGRAEDKCSCEQDACKLGKQAVDELRGLAGEMDSAIRNGGSPPSDAVQRQERIDNAINDASAAAERGKG
jgi:hypothetical protein